MSLKFTNIEEFESYVCDYMYEHDCQEAYVYLRSGYTEKGMLNSNFELRACICICGLKICWFQDWIEEQSFIEIASIITENEVIELAKAKEKNNDQSNKWIVTYAGYNAPDGYPVYKYICPYCGGGKGGKYCCDCGHRITGRIPDETVADDFKEIFIDNNEEN